MKPTTHFKIGDPVIFQQERRIVPIGERGTVINLHEAECRVWVTARFKSGKEFTFADEIHVRNKPFVHADQPAEKAEGA